MKNYIILFCLAWILFVSGCVAQTETKTTLEDKKVTEQQVQKTLKETSIEVLDYPAQVSDDQPFVVKWRIDGEPKNIEHTAIHYDYEPHDANYTAYRSVSAIYEGKSPKEFSANINALKVGFVFFRAHAIVEGKHYYSEEMKVEVIPYASQEENKTKTCPPCLEPTDWDSCINGQQTRQVYVCDENTNFLCQDRPETRTCTVEAQPVETEEIAEFDIDVSDSQFNPNSIQVDAGAKVSITFKAVSPQTFGGADIRDSNGLVKTGRIQKNTEKTVEFVMPNKDIKLTNYWPSSTQKKTDMWIKVK